MNLASCISKSTRHEAIEEFSDRYFEYPPGTLTRHARRSGKTELSFEMMMERYQQDMRETLARTLDRELHQFIGRPNSQETQETLQYQLERNLGRNNITVVPSEDTIRGVSASYMWVDE